MDQLYIAYGIEMQPIFEGIVFKSIEIVNEVMGRAKTSAGLKVFTSVLDHFLPKWNYVAVPSGRNQFPQLFNSRS